MAACKRASLHAMWSLGRSHTNRRSFEWWQSLRLRRFLLAGVFSVLYLVVLAVFYTQDKIDRETLLHACAIVAAFILVFFGLFRLGLNLRFPDPSLTGWQLLASVFTMLYVIYRAPDSR